MKSKIAIVVASFLLQFFVAKFLFAFFFMLSSTFWDFDTRSDNLEWIVYMLFALVPQAIALGFYAWRKHRQQSWLLGAGLYELAALLLGLLIVRVYDVGPTWFWLIAGMVFLVAHWGLWCATLALLEKAPTQLKKIGWRSLPVAAAIVLTLCTLFVMNVFTRDLEDSSSSVFRFLDIRDIFSSMGELLGTGLFSSFRWLLAFALYIPVFFVVMRLRQKKSGQPLAFLRKMLWFFVPLWIAIGAYGIVRLPRIAKNVAASGAYFQPVWDYYATIHPYVIRFGDASVTLWCDKKPADNGGVFACGDRMKVSLADAPVPPDETIYPQHLNIGLFENIPMHSDSKRRCAFTKNTVTVHGTLFFVTTEHCDPTAPLSEEGKPYRAMWGWGALIEPLMRCFGSEQCDLQQYRDMAERS